jgi:hypothetical protein
MRKFHLFSSFIPFALEEKFDVKSHWMLPAMWVKNGGELRRIIFALQFVQD